MYGNKVLISTNDMRMIAVNRDSGELIWEVNATAPTDPATGTPWPRTQGFTGVPLTIKTRSGKELVLQGESTGGQLRHAKLGRRLGSQAHLHDPGVGRAWFRDLEGQSQCLAHWRRRRVADRVL